MAKEFMISISQIYLELSKTHQQSLEDSAAPSLEFLQTSIVVLEKMKLSLQNLKREAASLYDF
jgi:hypothetical protein